MKKIKLHKEGRFGFSEAGDALRLPYAGARVAVQVVDAIGGYYKPGYASQEVVCRSKTGAYFLAREIYLDPLSDGAPRFTLPGEGYWLRVKRISLRAAVLHMTRGAASVFRADVLSALTLREEAA